VITNTAVIGIYINETFLGGVSGRAYGRVLEPIERAVSHQMNALTKVQSLPQWSSLFPSSIANLPHIILYASPSYITSSQNPNNSMSWSDSTTVSSPQQLYIHLHTSIANIISWLTNG
jgi:hypothetical protein